MRLFKYVSVGTINKIIENNSLRFTQPYELNDPFDMFPVYDDKITQMDNTGFLSKADIVEFYKYAININYLGLSMSKCMDSILMWSHYGENHRGVMLEFNLNSSFFYTKNNEGLAYSVPYSSIRPPFVSNEIVKKASVNRASSEEVEEIRKCIFTKAKCWDYEEEVRFIQPLSCLEKDDGTKLAYDKDGNGLFKILINPARQELKFKFTDIIVKKLETDTIKAVYFGVRTDEDTKEKIKKGLREIGINPMYFQSVASEEEYKISYLKIE